MAAPTLIDMSKIDPNDLDGILVLQVLLSQGLEISVYTRQVIIAQSAENRDLPRLSLVHGVPDTTILTSAVTVQNKRMRRALLERKGIPVPKGANFSIGRGITLSRKFAKEIKFPVVIKPGKGDVGFYNFTNVRNLREMNAAIAKMKVPVHERDRVFRAAYTPMELGMPGEENGRPTVSKSYRFLVEKRVEGTLLRFLVCEGKVVSVVLCEGALADGKLQHAEEVLDRIHPELIAKVEEANDAIPGLAVAAINVVSTAPELPLSEQEYWVVDFWERPLLWVQARTDADNEEALAEHIVASYFARRGYSMKPCSSEVTVGFQIHALPSASSSRDALMEAVEGLNISCDITEVSDYEGRISGTLTGSSFVVASLVNAITNEEIAGVPAMALDLLPTDGISSEGLN